MLDAAVEAVELAGERTSSEIEADRIRVLALERLFEVIGEAAAQTPDEVRARYPTIPWSRIVGMRNEIIHGYATVDVEIVVRTIRGTSGADRAAPAGPLRVTRAARRDPPSRGWARTAA